MTIGMNSVHNDHNSAPAPSPEERQRILRARAERIARRDDRDVRVERLEILAFRILSEVYAIETHFVLQVSQLRNLARIPCTPNFYLGVINVRGQLFPVIDLWRLFGHADRGITNASRVIILHHDGLEVGLLADGIEGAWSIDRAAILPLSGVASTIHEEFIRGMAPPNVVLLDTAKMLANPKLIVNEQVET